VSVSIGINIASFAPRAAFDAAWAAHIARAAGYEWVSVIPFWSLRRPRKLNLPVLFAEDAWNPGDIFDLIRRLQGDPEGILLQDWVMFPHSKSFCHNVFLGWLDFDRRTRPIVHRCPDFWDLQRKGYHPLLEVHPGLNMTPEQILQEGGMRLCLDTRHIREGGPLGPWRESIPKLLPYADLIDFQAKDPGELLRTVGGQVTELTRMVNTIRESSYVGPWRVEAHLGLLGQLRFGHLATVLATVRNWLQKNTQGEITDSSTNR